MYFSWQKKYRPINEEMEGPIQMKTEQVWLTYALLLLVLQLLVTIMMTMIMMTMMYIQIRIQQILRGFLGFLDPEEESATLP